MPFGEWRALSLHIYVEIYVHGLFMTATLYYGRTLFVTKPTLTTYLKQYFPVNSLLIPEKSLGNTRIFLGRLRVYIIDLVNKFIYHPYHSANPALNVNLHFL